MRDGVASALQDAHAPLPWTADSTKVLLKKRCSVKSEREALADPAEEPPTNSCELS